MGLASSKTLCRREYHAEGHREEGELEVGVSRLYRKTVDKKLSLPLIVCQFSLFICLHISCFLYLSCLLPFCVHCVLGNYYVFTLVLKCFHFSCFFVFCSLVYFNFLLSFLLSFPFFRFLFPFFLLPYFTLLLFLPPPILSCFSYYQCSFVFSHPLLPFAILPTSPSSSLSFLVPSFLLPFFPFCYY